LVVLEVSQRPKRGDGKSLTAFGKALPRLPIEMFSYRSKSRLQGLAEEATEFLKEVSDEVSALVD
jgi:hypothetical protein